MRKLRGIAGRLALRPEVRRQLRRQFLHRATPGRSEGAEALCLLGQAVAAFKNALSIQTDRCPDQHRMVTKSLTAVARSAISGPR